MNKGKTTIVENKIAIIKLTSGNCPLTYEPIDNPIIASDEKVTAQKNIAYLSLYLFKFKNVLIIEVADNELHCRRPGFLMLCPPVADVIY